MYYYVNDLCCPCFFSAFWGWARSHGKSLKTVSCVCVCGGRYGCTSLSLSGRLLFTSTMIILPSLTATTTLQVQEGFNAFQDLYSSTTEKKTTKSLTYTWDMAQCTEYTVYTSRCLSILPLLLEALPCSLKDNTTIASLRERRIPPVQIINDDIELPSRPNQAIVWHSTTDSLPSFPLPCIISMHACMHASLSCHVLYIFIRNLSRALPKEIYENLYFIISYAFSRRNVYIFYR